MIKLIKNWLPRQTLLRFDAAILTDIGGRDNLEDALGHLVIDPHTACWVVADGVGGQGAGEVASQLAVKAILNGFQSKSIGSDTHLQTLIESAHQAVFSARQADRSTANMATTLVAMLAANNQIVWGHVGDSRLYHFRAKRLLYRTEDHSLVNVLLARGALSKSDIPTFPQRNVILQALGQEKPLEISIHKPIKPRVGDGFLLCSDGVWELLDDEDLLKIWQESYSAAQWLNNLKHVLLPRVTEKNNSKSPADNFSAILIKVGITGVNLNQLR